MDSFVVWCNREVER